MVAFLQNILCFSPFFFLISLIMHDSYSNEFHDNYLVYISTHCNKFNMVDVVTLISRQISFLPFLDVIVVAMVLIFFNEKIEFE